MRIMQILLVLMCFGIYMGARKANRKLETYLEDGIFAPQLPEKKAEGWHKWIENLKTRSACLFRSCTHYWPANGSHGPADAPGLYLKYIVEVVFICFQAPAALLAHAESLSSELNTQFSSAKSPWQTLQRV